MYDGNREPTVEELLDDPIADQLMARDRLRPEHVWAFVNNARRKIRHRDALVAASALSRAGL